MLNVVYGVPAVPPAAPPAVWQALGMTWTGHDGSVWDLVDPLISGVSLQAGVRGLLLPEEARYTGVSPASAGSRYRGHRTLEREVFWPLKVYSDISSQAWIEHDRALFATLDIEQVGTWTVVQPDGHTRTLQVRWTGDGDGATDIDPTLVGWHVYGLYGVAEQPYWVGQLVSRAFRASSAVPFFVPGPSDDVLQVSEGSLVAGSVISNPGERPAWVQWWVRDAESAILGVGSRLIDVPFAVDTGRMLVIDTDPRVRTAIDIPAPPLDGSGNEQPLEAQRAWVAQQLPTGVNRTGELGPTTKFAPVDKGSAAPLSITVVGASASVRASLVPLHRRAW